MKNDGIEDIMIGANYNSNNKKGKKGIVIIFILLLLIISGAVIGYFYFSEPQITTKELFFTNLLNANVENIVDNSVYKEILNRMLTEDSDITTSVNFSTNAETQNLEEMDISKFILELNNKNDIETSKSYNELIVSYSENEVFKAKLLSDEENIAIASDEILDKYVGIRYNSIKDIFGIDIEFNPINNFKNAKKVNLTAEQQNEYLNKYLKKITDIIPEEKFEFQDNIVIQKDSISSNAKAYTLTLTQDEFKNILINLLTSLRNDEELLNQFITGENNYRENQIYDILLKIFSGRKIDVTTKQFQKEIDNLVERMEKASGNGLVVKIYVTDLGTEKINIVLPNENTLDIEFTKKSDEQNILKLTYLYKGNNYDLGLFESDEVKTYSANDNLDILENEVNDSEKSMELNGFSLEIDKTKKEANTSIKAVYSFIENEKINKKININLRTDGTTNSKVIKNSIVISAGENNGKSGQMTIENTIKFSNIEDIEDLTEENCLFLDNMNEEERNNTIQQIRDRIESLYNEKKSNLNFIDINTKSSIIKQDLDNASSDVSYEDARNALITRVSNMMRDAIENNEEFTIQNLVDLTIDGYEVSSTVNETSAVIVVDIYTFNIDSEFNLTDA